MKKKSIAVYGLGTETQRTLLQLKKMYKIAGLLDGYKTQGKQYGINIVQLENIIHHIEMIIVVARPGSCKAIARKIGDICRENNVQLVDVRGNDLLQKNKVMQDFADLNGYTKSELMMEIDKADVVSFDLFDTLIMRNVYLFMHLLQIVEDRFKEKKIFIDNFCDKRIAAEKQLSLGHAPTLREIYEKIIVENDSVVLSAEELAQIEYETDLKMLTARKEMVELTVLCKARGKRVYITTDCYYGRDKVKEILKKFQLGSIEELFISCEYGTAKTGNLYDNLIRAAGTTNILHIGNDDFADIFSAEEHGIKAFKIYSGEELLDAVGGLGLTQHILYLSDSIKVGMFIANLFNNPFQFETADRKIGVSKAEDIGYLFCSPMIMDFIYWFGEQVKKGSFNNIWFCARDGYLIKKIFEQIYSDIKSVYFLTSRISAIRAGVSDEIDIAYVDTMKFSGSIEENLLTRFGIKTKTLRLVGDKQNRDSLLQYKDDILESALQKRVNNQKYIDKLSIRDGGIALFDFVAKGTSQMYIQKMVPFPITGLYFLQLEPEFMKEKSIDVKPFYTEKERMDSAIFNNYYILETILTSPDPSVAEFNENGNAVYAQETRSKKDIDCFMKVQSGILEYVEMFSSICPKSEVKINKKIDEVFLMLIHSITIMNEDFLALKDEDPFFNRMTDITDVL